jgi:hypothetical protein
MKGKLDGYISSKIKTAAFTTPASLSTPPPSADAPENVKRSFSKDHGHYAKPF